MAASAGSVGDIFVFPLRLLYGAAPATSSALFAHLGLFFFLLKRKLQSCRVFINQNYRKKKKIGKISLLAADGNTSRCFRVINVAAAWSLSWMRASQWQVQRVKIG